MYVAPAPLLLDYRYRPAVVCRQAHHAHSSLYRCCFHTRRGTMHVPDAAPCTAPPPPPRRHLCVGVPRRAACCGVQVSACGRACVPCVPARCPFMMYPQPAPMCLVTSHSARRLLLLHPTPITPAVDCRPVACSASARSTCTHFNDNNNATTPPGPRQAAAAEAWQQQPHCCCGTCWSACPGQLLAAACRQPCQCCLSHQLRQLPWHRCCHSRCC